MISRVHKNTNFGRVKLVRNKVFAFARDVWCFCLLGVQWFCA